MENGKWNIEIVSFPSDKMVDLSVATFNYHIFTLPNLKKWGEKTTLSRV